MENHHTILGVRDGADHNEIRAAFRRRALEYHPDVRGGDDRMFVAVRRAYEALVNPVETREAGAARLYEEMEGATRWCAGPSLSSSSSCETAAFGGVELERRGGSVRVVGRVKAGRFAFDGRIMVYGDVSSPPWGEYMTVLDAGSSGGVDVRGDVLNGATVRGRDISAVDVLGLRRVKRDDVRVGVSWDVSLRTRIMAGGNVMLRHCHGPADIQGDVVDVWDVRDGCVLEARRAVVRGSTITHDCMIRVSESLAFATRSMLGLSDDCAICWGGGKRR